MKYIKKDEQASCTGKAGKRSLVAVDDKVYDVTESRLWRDGKHANAHLAGSDLSAEIQVAPHGYEVFERVELVGEFDQTMVEPKRLSRAT